MWKPVWDNLMPTPASIDEKWMDIIPPVAPAHSADPAVTGIVVAVLLVLIGLGVFFCRRPRSRAKRALRRLARDLHASRIEIKPACYEIQRWLRSGLGQSRLQAVKWSHVDSANWLAYVNRLAQYCFGPEPPATDELDGVIHEALAWLNRKVDGS